MRVGILGCGYVGQAIALSLKESDHIVSATTRRPEHFEKLQAIVEEPHLISRSIDLIPFLSPLEVLIICVAPNTSNDYRSTYLELAESVVKMIAHADRLHQIIYTSSTSVYGDFGGAWVNEESEVRPLNENSQILLETENCYLSISKSGVRSCIFRLGEIYGPGRLIEERLKKSYHRKFPGDGSQYTNLIHLDDIVKAVNLAIDLHLQGVYNLCNDNHISRKEFYDSLCKLHDIPLIQWDDQMMSPHGGNKRVDNQKIKNLGFIPGLSQA
jgi:nucleoside-diphosphate-sugar epimerase